MRRYHLLMNKLAEAYFKKMRGVEEKLITFIENIDNSDDNFINLLQDQKFFEDKNYIKSFLYLIVAVSNNYHHLKHFFTKIDSILQSLKVTITKHFNNYEIFHIFQTNKRLLLFLFEQEIITPTYEIYSIIINNQKYISKKYLEYFYPEFEQYMNEEEKKSILCRIQELNENKIEVFKEKRLKGENDNYITELIQNDQIIDFISYLNKANISPSSIIQPSIYETNLFLITKKPTLIEYATFCGSIQTFRYLYQQNVEVTPSIWLYAIHGKNAEIIHFLEDQKIPTFCNTIQYLAIESIKCHHSELTDYFRDRIRRNENIYNDYLYRKSLKYYNFVFLAENKDVIKTLIQKQNETNIHYYLCKYDYDLISIFFHRSSLSTNILNVNQQYEIYQPVIQKDKDIVYYIEIANGNIDPKSKEREYKYIRYDYNVQNTAMLHIAIQKGNIDIVKFLIEIPDINIKINSIKTSKKAYRPLQVCYANRDDSKKMPILYEYCIVTEKKTILSEAVECGCLEIIQNLLKLQSIDVNETLIIEAIFSDCLTTAYFYYSERNENSLFNHAIEMGNVEIVNLLLSDQRVNINKNSVCKTNKGGGCMSYESSSSEIAKTPLYLAIDKNNIAIVQSLLSNPRIDINFQSVSYIHKQKGEIVKRLSAHQFASEKRNNEIMKLTESKTITTLPPLFTNRHVIETRQPQFTNMKNENSH